MFSSQFYFEIDIFALQISFLFTFSSITYIPPIFFICSFSFLSSCLHSRHLARWEFFINFHTTSHGKNACDRIRGTVKRATARASLQRTTERQILTPEDMFQFCEEKLSDKIKYFFVTEPEVKDAEQRLEHRFKDCMTIPGSYSKIS